MIESEPILRKENLSTFEARLGVFSEESQDLILQAYDFAKNAHSRQRRRTQERYFEHPRSAAIILLDECGITDPDLIIAAILHDTVEDTSLFGSNKKKGKLLPYSTWTQTASRRITKSFNERVAGIVIAVTTPQIEGIEMLTPEDVEAKHIELLANNPDALLIKMADRLHNLRDMANDPAGKILAKIKETEDIYLPLFEAATEVYPQATPYLIGQIRAQISSLKAGIAQA